MYPRDEGFPVYRIESVAVDDSTSCTACVISPEIFQSFANLLQSTKVSLTVHCKPVCVCVCVWVCVCVRVYVYEK